FNPTLYRTGGSTGRPLIFYNSKKTFEYHLAAMYRAWKWIGFDFGSKYADLWGATFDLKDEHKLKKRIHMWLTHNRLLVPSFRFTPEELEKYSEQIVRFKPEYIHGYASSIEVMADYMKKRGMSLEGVKGVITSGEKLFPHQRKKIESFFNSTVYDDYGSRESSIRATQCEEAGGYHISVENGVLELLKDGDIVSEGTPGKVTITEFHNYAMPLIRYENGDVAEALDDSCSCGRSLPMLKRVDGRISDIFVTKDGKVVPGEMFMYIFLDFTGESYQVIQKTPERIILKIVPGDNYDYSNIDSIVSELKKWLGDIEVEVKYVKSIPKTNSGKRRFLISEVKPRF
ncbi:phenylacetate--CoA ligase family protein, partial [Candidatus Woesearchaeota archaeon]